MAAAPLPPTFGDKLVDATDRIVEAFNRLVAVGRDGVAERPAHEQIIYYIVATRCEIDIGGFSAVYEQDLNPTQISILVDGLNTIGEKDLADAFYRGFRLLKDDGFYEHMDWNKVSNAVKSELEVIGLFVGDRLWALDRKLAVLLD